MDRIYIFILITCGNYGGLNMQSKNTIKIVNLTDTVDR
jgi:hypothetical protein